MNKIMIGKIYRVLPNAFPYMTQFGVKEGDICVAVEVNGRNGEFYSEKWIGGKRWWMSIRDVELIGEFK